MLAIIEEIAREKRIPMTKEKPLSTISIIGAGYVGLTTAALLAESGYNVYLVDINQERLSIIKSGRSFFFEEGLNPLIAHSIKNGVLHPTDSYENSIPKSDFVFSCVGTPDNPDGSSNLRYVFSAAEQASKLMKAGGIYIQKSTVPVGTGAKIIEQCSLKAKKIAYISNPEFLREGTAIIDTLWFDRIVVGGDDKQAVEKVLNLYHTIEQNRDAIAARANIHAPNVSAGGIYISTNRDSAELIKVTANAFLALKISFANSIAKLADRTGADINEVMSAVGADRRIGRAFLNAGRGYGGGCFPKDVSGLISSANDHGVDMPIMVAATDVNESMPGYIAEKAQAALGTLRGKKVAVLGLAFKAGTSDTRRSPGVKIANILDKNGAKVRAFDPQANGDAKKDLRPDIIICNSTETAIKDVDAVFVATEWPEFVALEPETLAKHMAGKVVVDGMNVFDKENFEKSGLVYIGVGR